MENNDEFLKNNASVENEPKQNFHFRYESEIKQGNTHGVLNGQKGNYPKIKLLLPDNGDRDEWGNERDFYVLCSLHCFANNKPLSPHLLMMKGERELNYQFRFEKMETCEGKPVERVWELRDYVIVRLKNMDYKNSLENKQRQFNNLNLPLKFERILGKLNLNDSRSVKDSGKLNVCLGFTIFEKKFYENTYSLYRDTIYSCNIYHGDDLRIHKLCNTKGSILGGTEISMLIRLEPNLPLNVLIKKINENTKKTEWSREVPILESNKFQNASLSFILPRYKENEEVDDDDEDQDDEIEVYMCVKVRNTTYKSDNVKFYYVHEKSRKRTKNTNEYDDYLAENEGKRSRKAICYISRDSSDLTSDISLIQNECCKQNNIKYQIDSIFNKAKNNIYYKSMDSVFYNALELTDTLIHLYTKANECKRQDLINHFRNKNRENLLHYACRMNYSKSIRPLIGLGCHINQQDLWGRTPLHFAIAARNNDCILEIQKLFKNYSQYSKNVEVDLVKMLKAYSHNGYTVLHEAVLNQYNELLEIVMEFMQEHELNILDYEVLGSGDSIVHLAAKNNTLTSIETIIAKYIPNHMSVKNYAGIMAKEFNDEFSEKLSI